ncbi:uncharacterized protein [Glycine max]|uniref:uncharacterized protein n=1 Tax=Glycine max TaxID=3847 RepID=UPI0003DEA306|nr:uncharacterized protein LOC102661394 [Glycine max]|eukprot:XP_006577644.1 uncharacterized protein LOC102661394 [Glycine max]
MDEDQWAYYSAMFEEVDMDFQDEQDCGVNEGHVDCSDAFNTSQVFATREDVLKWARTVAHENSFVAVFMRSDTYTGSRGRTSFVLIGCERSVHGGEGWAVKLICGIHNHELAKTLVGHPYAGRLTDDEKNIIVDMTKYRLPLLDFVGVTPTGMTFSAGFAYLEGEHVNNLVWALERFHIDKNVKAKCKSLIGQKNAWDYVMDSWGNLNSVGDLCRVWDAMNNMMTLHHTEIRASFETSTHVVGHVFKKTLYKRLLGMVSRYALNEILIEFERVRHFKDNLSSCGCVLRTTLGLPCACELQRYDGGSIPLDAVHMYWRRLNFSDQGLCEAEVSIKEEMDRIYKRFKELDVCGKVTFKSKLREFAFPDKTSMCPPPTKVKTKGAPKKVMKRSERSTKCDPSYWEYVDAYHSVQNSNTSVKPNPSSFEPLKPTRMIPMLDQFPPFMHGFIEDVVDVKADGNCGYRSVSALLGMGEECWAMMRNELIKELDKWSQDYIKIFGGTKRYEQMRLSLHVDGLSKVSMDKWMDIMDMGYVIASRYNVIFVSLSRQQSFTFFPLRSRPPANSSAHRKICVGHVFSNHFVQVH